HAFLRHSSRCKSSEHDPCRRCETPDQQLRVLTKPRFAPQSPAHELRRMASPVFYLQITKSLPEIKSGLSPTGLLRQTISPPHHVDEGSLATPSGAPLSDSYAQLISRLGVNTTKCDDTPDVGDLQTSLSSRKWLQTPAKQRQKGRKNACKTLKINRLFLTIPTHQRHPNPNLLGAVHCFLTNEVCAPDGALYSSCSCFDWYSSRWFLWPPSRSAICWNPESGTYQTLCY